MSLIYVVLAFLAIIGGAMYRLQRTRIARGARSRLTDDMIRSIEDEGVLRTDEEEPLDLDEIRAEEERFWQESWDEPDEP